MQYQISVTLEDGRKIEGASKADVNRKVRLLDVADKLASAALAADGSIADDEALAKICLALALSRMAVTSASVVERKKRAND